MDSDTEPMAPASDAGSGDVAVDTGIDDGNLLPPEDDAATISFANELFGRQESDLQLTGIGTAIAEASEATAASTADSMAETGAGSINSRAVSNTTNNPFFSPQPAPVVAAAGAKAPAAAADDSTRPRSLSVPRPVTPSTAYVSNLKVLMGATLVADAQFGRPSFYNTGPEVISSYRLYHSRSLTWALVFFLFLDMALALFEDPNVSYLVDLLLSLVPNPPPPLIRYIHLPRATLAPVCHWESP